MSKKEAPLDYLRRWIPEQAAPLILEYLNHYNVHLTITRERKSVLGDYRHATRTSNHRISVNGNLNHYSFLITLIHELAHLVTFMEWGNGVNSHGKEWKGIYRKMLEEFIRLAVFPKDILAALKKSLHNLPASSCADEDLMRVLKKYDENTGELLLVEQIPEGGCFSLEDKRVFRRGKKLRKRYQCLEIATGKLYLFSPIYEVRPAS
ncbi:SprT-like domain-containing protein [Puia dinghuensis]|uniref:Metallopeptidase n=1 Tax=Puia dinghuensis TaxID=1792502 RepID=A0A8J2UBA4_9BACT|nr:SprT-like domain-containing protein [Puia dinghuensis]GGA91401.1 metallopeptidase [Puia dinghuensis]